MCSIPCFKFQSTNIFSDIEHIPNRSRKRIGTHRDTYVTGIGPLDRDQSEIEFQGKKIKFFNVKEFGEYLETEANSSKRDLQNRVQVYAHYLQDIARVGLQDKMNLILHRN